MLTNEHICVIFLYMVMKMKVKVRMLCLFNSIIALCAGTLIYILFREDTYIHRFLFLDSTVIRTPVTDFISFYFADGLWAYALFFSLELIWKNRMISFASSFSFCMIWEALQYLGIVGGTFDFLDLITYLAAIIVAVIILIQWRKHYEENNN